MPKNCAHNITEAAQWPRWRYCMMCDALVHRVETNHYARLFVPPRPRFVGRMP